MTSAWPELPYDAWSATRTRCIRTPRVLGKLAALAEYILDWEDVVAGDDPHALALDFARSAFGHACEVCAWDPALAASAEGKPPVA